MTILLCCLKKKPKTIFNSIISANCFPAITHAQTHISAVYGLNWVGENIPIRQWRFEDGIAYLILNMQQSLTPPLEAL